MKLIGRLAALLLFAPALAGSTTGSRSMELGNFSASLSVNDIEASKTFYQKLGFVQVLGDPGKGWAIMKNGSTNIGLFQGMFEKNLLTFNPGSDQEGKPSGEFEDVRSIQKRLKSAGIDVGAEIESKSGPASFMITDPDGNPILLDQHR